MYLSLTLMLSETEKMHMENDSL